VCCVVVKEAGGRWFECRSGRENFFYFWFLSTLTVSVVSFPMVGIWIDTIAYHEKRSRVWRDIAKKETYVSLCKQTMRHKTNKAAWLKKHKFTSFHFLFSKSEVMLSAATSLLVIADILKQKHKKESSEAKIAILMEPRKSPLEALHVWTPAQHLWSCVLLVTLFPGTHRRMGLLRISYQLSTHKSDSFREWWLAMGMYWFQSPFFNGDRSECLLNPHPTHRSKQKNNQVKTRTFDSRVFSLCVSSLQEEVSSHNITFWKKTILGSCEKFG